MHLTGALKKERTGAYLDGARDMQAELQANLAAAELDRAAIAAIAHRLAGSSFSVCATSLGQSAKCLERAADTAARPVLAEMQAALTQQYEQARETIHDLLAVFADTMALSTCRA